MRRICTIFVAMSLICGCLYSAHAGDFFYDMLIWYNLTLVTTGAVPANVQIDSGKLMISLEQSYFEGLESAEIDYPEHVKQATLYTLSLPDGVSYPATGEEVTPTVNVDASAYGPGVWMINYGLLTIGEPVYTNNIQAGTATVSVDFVVEYDKTYTLTKTFTITGGAMPERMPGDADDSEGVELSDAVAILRAVAGEDVDINAANADVNGDGQADLYDVLLILQYIAGWNVSLQ